MNNFLFSSIRFKDEFSSRGSATDGANNGLRGGTSDTNDSNDSNDVNGNIRDDTRDTNDTNDTNSDPWTFNDDEHDDD